ncbi:hypothetical protein CQE41_26390, partial [Salmonella enterica subsp. enterica]|nr:hypothetical protein [Salmonella enterica subsp. enterica]
GQLKVTNEIQSTYADGFRIAYGSYGSYWRNDGANLYLMLTDKDKPFGGYNALRPFMVNLASGEVTLGRAKFSDYTYLDARYQAKGNYTPAGEAYTKAVSDGRFQPKGNYTPAGEAYTKAVSDGRFQPKGSYTPAGQAYTKGESDGRYVQNMRLGTAATINIGGNGSVPGGCVVVGAGTDDWKLNRLIYKPIQRNINGVWATISG